MSTAKAILEKVKALFNAPVIAPVVEAAAPAPAPVAAPAGRPYKTKEGADISIAQAGEQPAVGDAVTIGGVPAAEGVLTLEDGTTITVDAAGKISAITPPAPVTNDMTTTAAPAQVAPAVIAPVAAPQFSIEDIPGMFASHNAAIDTSFEAYDADLAALKAQIAKQDEVIKGLFEFCEKIADVPTADPKTLTGNKKDKFERTADKREHTIEKFAAGIKKLKEENSK
jgi:hypothetical protein